MSQVLCEEINKVTASNELSAEQETKTNIIRILVLSTTTKLYRWL